MVTLEELTERWQVDSGAEYRCARILNLYKTTTEPGLVTQAAAGRQLKVTKITPDGIHVILSEDDYPGWLRPDDSEALTPAETPYRAPTVTRSDVERAIPEVIAFTQAAMAAPNEYLWGGTVAPNYDCSGLMQAAFASAGIPLPRDAYQQEAFTHRLEQDKLRPGDLIFFGTLERITHVALYLENGRYIHSSGKDQGRNSIGIDSIVDLSDPVSQTYYRQYRCGGRIMGGYKPRQMS
ncbi:MAG: C40 family peptidase [Leptolyngbyaceae cyanobacterium]